MNGIPPRTPALDRLAGLDLARALALIGMLMMHIGPVNATGIAGNLYALPDGRASLLFVLVAGVGVSLMAASRQRRAEPRLLWRALLLLPLGLALQVPDGAPVIILPLYALLFVLATGLVRLPDRFLLFACGITALAGPAGFLLGYLETPAAFDHARLDVREGPGPLLHGLVLSGPHPLMTWTPPFLLGLWLGRLDLRDPVAQFLLVSIGGLVALACATTALVARALLGDALDPAGWLWLLHGDAHSQMPLWLWGGTASAAAILGFAFWLAGRAGRILRPLIVTGRVALSFYVVHVLALILWPDALRFDDPIHALGITLALTTTVAVAAIFWLRAFRHGPLEVFMHPPGLPPGWNPVPGPTHSA